MQNANTGRAEHLITVNGEQRRVSLRPADTLLYTLRDELGLTGAKPGCENGDCGACTVLVNDVPMKSCLLLTMEFVDQDPPRSVETVEGLDGAEVQRQFLQHWAFQCGYCTSGFLMLVEGLRRQRPEANRDELVDWLRSNICRCTSYAELIHAVEGVLERERGAAPASDHPTPVPPTR
ncbi:MAG: (2Fe-2S)-binding protein [Thermaerobacter sp.]|nr:(2Fe-2S)-binding protein [Thermaerobacter sp.]